MMRLWLIVTISIGTVEAFEVGGNAFYLALYLTVCAWMAFAVTNDPFNGNAVSGAHGGTRLYALDCTEIEVTARGLQLNALRTCRDWPYRLCYLQLTWSAVWGVVRDQNGHSCKVLGSNAALMSLLSHAEVHIVRRWHTLSLVLTHTPFRGCFEVAPMRRAMGLDRLGESTMSLAYYSERSMS